MFLIFSCLMIINPINIPISSITSQLLYPLVIYHSHGIDGPSIDGLPIKMGGSFHGKL